MYIVITGTPGDGFRFHGPFVDRSDAIDYAVSEFDNKKWWIEKLVNPKD